MCQSFFAVFKKQPVTIEEFVQGEFHKYVNNNGFHIPSTSVEFDEVYEKAQCLVHHSYQISEKKLLVDDASLDSNKVNFCAGNLFCIAIL